MAKHRKPLVGRIALAAFLLLAALGIVTFMPSVSAESHSHSSATGYFGLDDDGLPVVDRHGIMLVFDGDIAPETVSVSTFEVSLNDGSFAEVIETRVEGRYVFLRLKNELDSDATPIIGIAEGEEVEDLAGNSTNKQKLGFVQIKDGIAPRLTMTLSGGSGLGTGDEGPNRLTNDTIVIRITSDEPLQGAPRVVVVCDDLSWVEREGSREIERDIDDFVANRNGPFARRPQEPSGTTYTCGYDTDGDGHDDPFELTEDIANSRPGEVWEYTWRNPSGALSELKDGSLAVVAYARDRARYERFGETVSNWAAATSEFGLDTQFVHSSSSNVVKIHPPGGSVIRDERPFILLRFPTETTVTLKSVTLDGQQVVEEFETVRHNEFVFWPLSMNQGDHEVDVEATDAASNTIQFDFAFSTTQRGDFVLPLVAGWNAVSVPADPIDPEIENVFTDPAIEAVISWNPYDPEEPWAVSIRDVDAWEPWRDGRGVTEIQAGTGYWIKSAKFIEQPIALSSSSLNQGRRGLESDDYDGGCESRPGWFFLGVTDVDGDQTQNHFGKPLKNRNVVISVRDYFGERLKRAYTWDPIEWEYHKLEKNEVVKIGQGIWYYGGSTALCP